MSSDAILDVYQATNRTCTCQWCTLFLNPLAVPAFHHVEHADSESGIHARCPQSTPCAEFQKLQHTCADPSVKGMGVGRRGSQERQVWRCVALRRWVFHNFGQVVVILTTDPTLTGFGLAGVPGAVKMMPGAILYIH